MCEKSKSTSSWRTSKNGYDIFELISGMQKCIRRGQCGDSVIRDACWYAFELSMGQKSQYTIMRNRLICIANEDVGPGDFEAVHYVHSAIPIMDAAYNKSPDHSKKGEWDLILANIIIRLCRARKSHEAVHLAGLIWSQQSRDPRVPKLMDCAIDKHTARGKRMGRGWKHFFTESFRLFGDVARSPWQDSYDKANWEGEHNGHQIQHDYDKIDREPNRKEASGGQTTLDGF